MRNVRNVRVENRDKNYVYYYRQTECVISKITLRRKSRTRKRVFNVVFIKKKQ